MAEYRLTEAGRIGLRMLLDAESLCRADRRGLHLLGMDDVVDLPDEWTEPAPPPLPPEPAVGEFVACGGDGNLLPFFRHWSEGWSVVSRDPVFAEVQSWAGVVAVARERAKRDPVRLVPVPEPVTLPWEHGRQRITVGVDGAGRGIVAEWINNDIVHSGPAVARAKAYALLSAADQAEADGRG